MRIIIAWFQRFFYTFKEIEKQKQLTALLERKMTEVNDMRITLDKKISAAEVVYTPVKSFNSEAGDKLFWPWAKELLTSEQYKYLIFFMRANNIRELVQTSDVNMVHELNGRLKMLQIIDNFLTTGLTQYDNENKVQRDRQA